MNLTTSKIQKKSCCKNETTFVDSSTFNKEKTIAIQSVTVEFVFAYAYSFINLYQNTVLEKEYYKDFSPPDIEHDIQVLHQSFLI